MVRPVLPTHLLKARARRVIESISRNTSLPISASRLQRSTTSCESRTWLSTSRSRLLAITSPLTRALHVGHFLGPLVDQQHDQLDVRDSSCEIAWLMCCKQDRLAGARRGDDQGPLAFAQRREQVHHAGGQRRRARFPAAARLRG